MTDDTPRTAQRQARVLSLTLVPSLVSAPTSSRRESVFPAFPTVSNPLSLPERHAYPCEVAPHGGPPLHVHHDLGETLHVRAGRFKVRVGEHEHILEADGFVHMPKGLPHAFLNLTDQPAELIIVFAPGVGRAFFEELGPATRAAHPDRAAIAAKFERHGMTLLGLPLSAD